MCPPSCVSKSWRLCRIAFARTAHAVHQATQVMCVAPGGIDIRRQLLHTNGLRRTVGVSGNISRAKTTARTGSVCSPKPTSDPCPTRQRQPATPSGPRLAVAQQRLSSRTRELSARSTSSRVQRKSRQRHRCQPIASATATRSSLHNKRSLRASRSVLKSSLSTDPPDEGSAKRTRRPQRRKAETTETAVSFLTHRQRWKIEQNTKQPPYTTNKLTKLLAALVIPTTLKSRTAYG